MGFGERAKMTKGYREAITATVLTYMETAKELGQDPLGMARLPMTGCVFLSKELNMPRPNDAAYWAVLDPATGKVISKVKLADDLSRWRQGLNAQLAAWDQKSIVKQRRNKRARNGAIIAAIVVAVAVTAVFAAPLVLGGGGAAAASAGTGSGAAAGAAGFGPKILKALGALGRAAAQGKDLAAAAAAGEAALPPDLQQGVETVADQTSYEAAGESDPKDKMAWIAAAIVAAGGLVALAVA